MLAIKIRALLVLCIFDVQFYTIVFYAIKKI